MRRFDPDTVHNGNNFFFDKKRRTEVFIYWVYFDIFRVGQGEDDFSFERNEP